MTQIVKEIITLLFSKEKEERPRSLLKPTHFASDIGVDVDYSLDLSRWLYL